MSMSKKYNCVCYNKENKRYFETDILVVLEFTSNFPEDEDKTKFLNSLKTYCNLIDDLLMEGNISEITDDNTKVVFNNKPWHLPHDMFIEQSDNIRNWNVMSRKCNEDLILRTYDLFSWNKEMIALRNLFNPYLLFKLFSEVKDKRALLIRFKNKNYYTLLKYLSLKDICSKLKNNSVAKLALSELELDFNLGSTFKVSQIYSYYGL